MRRPRTGGILGPDIVDQPSGILFWDVLRALKHHLDQPVFLDDIIYECRLIYADSEEYGIRKARAEVQNTISKLRQEGYAIESIKEEGKQIAYCWAGEHTEKNKEPAKNGAEIVRVEVDCVFRGIIRSREFTTFANKEACNMLKNKLDRAGVVEQPGRLIFEFDPRITTSWLLSRKEIDSQICTCGHNRFAHVYRYHRKDRGRCQIEGCGCRQYISKPKG